MNPNKQAKILIIDDDLALAEAIRIVLEAKHYRVAGASDTDEGWRKVEEEEPDLIILDVMMERLNSGFVLCRKLKKDARYKDIPILILTAVDREFHFRFGDDAGGEEWLPSDAYLDKPVEPSRLLTEIENLLKKE